MHLYVSLVFEANPGWVDNLISLFETIQDMQTLEMNIRNGHLLPAQSLAGLRLPQLQVITSRDICHKALHPFLRNHPDLTGIYLGPSKCEGKSCPLRIVRFRQPISVTGGSSCVVGLLAYNTVTWMGVQMYCERDANCTTERLMKPLLARSAGDALSVLRIKFDHHDEQVLRKIVDACRNLTYLDLESRTVLRGVSSGQPCLKKPITYQIV
jgi:hypothetical protein